MRLLTINSHGKRTYRPLDIENANLLLDMGLIYVESGQGGARTFMPTSIVPSQAPYEFIQGVLYEYERQANHKAPNTAKHYRLLWPEKRTVQASQIYTWYKDAVADGDIKNNATTIDSMALALHDLGLITLQKS